jgi:hypothetical protein
MHSNLLEMSREAREHIQAPSFPLHAIRAATARPATQPPRRQLALALLIAGISVAAIATAAEVTHQARLVFPHSGGIIVSSNGAKLSSREIHTDAEVFDAAKRLDFQAVLPAGLPDGATPIKVDMAGTSLLVITYALPAQSGDGHKLWMFLANPAVLSPANAARYRSRHGYPSQQWRVGAEQVIVVSDGLTASGFAAIKGAMLRSATGP